MGYKYIKRDLFDSISEHLDKDEITFITGPRQVGKTILLNQLEEELVRKGVLKQHILRFDLDQLSDRAFFKSQTEFIALLKGKLSGSRLYVFVDEAQRATDPGIFFKGIYDLNLPIKFVLTGSSTLEFRAKTFESLTGRKRIFSVYPFSFHEYLRAKAEHLIPALWKLDALRFEQQALLTHLEDFLIFGGYPRVVLEKNVEERKKLLEELFNSYVDKDVVGFSNVKNSWAFTNCVRLLAHQVGQLVNENNIAQETQVKVLTLRRYLSILENTFVIYRLRPYFTNRRKELTKTPKIYLIDNGLLNWALKNFQSWGERFDKGLLLENWVVTEFLKRGDFELKYWRTLQKTEVDFVVSEKFDQRWIPLEVKSTMMERPEISKSFRAFLNQYHPEEGYILNWGYSGDKKEDETLLHWRLPFRLRTFKKEGQEAPCPHCGELINVNKATEPGRHVPYGIDCPSCHGKLRFIGLPSGGARLEKYEP